MSGLHNSLNNRTSSNHPNNSGRSLATSFSAQSGAPSPVFHPTGSKQGLHNIHGSFNVANMPGTLGYRSSTTNDVPACGNFSSGRFASNNIPIPPSQISHGSSHGHSGVTNRGGMSVVGIPGYNSSASGVGGAVPGMGVSQISGNAVSVLGAGLSIPDLTSRLNLPNNSGLGNVNMQGSNRLMGGVFEQGNSYSGSRPLSQNHVQSVNSQSSMRFSNDVNANDDAPFDLNDFPELNGRPSSAGGPLGQGQGQRQGPQRKQGLGAIPIVQQQNQEFSIQNEDFPGFKGRNADYSMDSYQNVHDNAVSMMQPQKLSVGRSAGFNLSGSFSSHHPQQQKQQQQHPPSVSGIPFSSSHASYHPQISHGSSHGHSGVTNRGGMSVVGIPGYNSSASGVGGAVPGMGVSQISGNAGSALGARLSIPDPTSRLNQTNNSGLVNVNVQGSNRLMGGVFEQASAVVSSMLGNSYSGSRPLYQNHVQSVNNQSFMRFSTDVNANDDAPFDLNEFPELNGRPSSAGGPQGQGQRQGPREKQGLGAIPIVQQQNQEFSIQNEDFPGFKGRNADYAMHSHQKVHDNAVSMMQLQKLAVGRSAGFNLSGSFSSHHPQQQQQLQHEQQQQQQHHHQQQQLHPTSVSGSGFPFSSSHASYHPQTGGPPPGLGSRPLTANTVSGLGSYDQQQYQQNPSSEFRLQHISGASQSHSYQGMNLMQPSAGQFGMQGLVDEIRKNKMNGSSLALGMDLSTLGLPLTSAENLYPKLVSVLSNEPLNGVSEFTLPQCYYNNTQQPPALIQKNFSKFQQDTLFYIFYSMPEDIAQLYAANELHNRGWLYHRGQQIWFTRIRNNPPLLRTDTYEIGSYTTFDSKTWKTDQKDNFVVQYGMLENRPDLPQQH